MRTPQAKSNDPTDAKGQAAVAETTVRLAGGRPGVLVVDDEHLVRIMVQLCLERNGYDVWLARSGREAIDLYRQHRDNVAIVLLDVCMPGLDGIQALKVLREVNPIVLACFMSGDTRANELEELLQRGTTYFIAKPFRLDDLANLLRLMVQSVPLASCDDNHKASSVIRSP